MTDVISVNKTKVIQGGNPIMGGDELLGGAVRAPSAFPLVLYLIGDNALAPVPLATVTSLTLVV